MSLSNYIIKRIYLKNFKSVDEAFIDFEGVNLNILDGPNGFGKTTIYDAIQLLLTGTVRRIESNRIVSNNRGFNDQLLAKDQSKKTIIKIEFASKEQNEDKVVLARVLSPWSLSNSQKKPHDFSHFKLFLLYEFEDEEYNELIPETQIGEIFGVKDIQEMYNLYHYIEQEESTYLFKQNEKDRMSAITKLFNIEEEMNQKAIIEKVKSKLGSYKLKMDREAERLENQLKKEIVTEVDKLEYKPLIDEENPIDIPWDKKHINPLDRSIKEEYLEELDLLNNLLLNQEDFKKELVNEELTGVIHNEEKLKAIIVLGHFNDMYDKLEKQYLERNKLVQIVDTLRNKDIMQKKIDWNFVVEKLEIKIDLKEIKNRVDNIKYLSSSSNTISTVVNQMNQTRGRLEKDFEKFINLSPDSKKQCPMCGDTKESVEILIEEINEKTQNLSKHLDKSTQHLDEEIGSLYRDFLNNMIEKIDEKVESINIDEGFISQMRECKNTIPDMDKAKTWFIKNNIDVEKFINKDYLLIEDLEIRIANLRIELEERKQKVSEFCKDNMDAFKRVYRDRLSKNLEKLAKLNIESIQYKKRYVENQYYLQASVTFQKFHSLKKRLKEVNEKFESLARLTNVYNKKINSYRAKMINDIEIPFYIYSGKIIQNHQRGLGVFIREERATSETGIMQLKSINFIPPARTDHDIVHSFSSGQLSSTLIAFTLALNKVYGKRGLMTLLIDDPVQTMDEMNMASFVELLRNDFNDRQLILSTHEDNISLYMRYKFLKYNLSVGNINVKQKLYV
jgi:DNA repair protein SbcC/Rad50